MMFFPTKLQSLWDWAGCYILNSVFLFRPSGAGLFLRHLLPPNYHPGLHAGCYIPNAVFYIPLNHRYQNGSTRKIALPA
jgi:hypothetical protein